MSQISQSTRTRLALVFGRMAALDTKVMAEYLRLPAATPHGAQIAAEGPGTYGQAKASRRKRKDPPASPGRQKEPAQ